MQERRRGAQGRSWLFVGLLGSAAALVLLCSKNYQGGRVELLRKRGRGHSGVQLAARKIEKGVAFLKCIKTQALGWCPQPKVQDGEASGFGTPQFEENGAQWNENSAGWTAAGVLDNAPGAWASIDQFHQQPQAGDIKEIFGEPSPAGTVAHRGGQGTSCGCAVCPCRGDDDLDVLGNGEWSWPIAVRQNREMRGKRYVPKRAAQAAAVKCPDCKYTAIVKPLTEHYLATVRTAKGLGSGSGSGSSSSKNVKTKVITKYVKVPEPVYKTRTVYKEKTVYVPVYDDPFWNPEADGRLAGEGVGMPHASPMGAQKYDTGAWYEWGKPRHNMLDALGGTLDSDHDVDHPADLGVWWADSLPDGKFASSLSDSDSF